MKAYDVVMTTGSYLAAATTLVITGYFANRYRLQSEREAPIELWGRTMPSAESAARHLAEVTGLRVEHRPARLRWLFDLTIEPILLIWGDRRSRRPERHLARWRLVGVHAGREVVVELGPDAAIVAMTCRVPLGATSGIPFEQQEALRPLHPVGGERWQTGIALVRAVLAHGPERLRWKDGKLRVELALQERGSASDYPPLIGAMSSLASFVERP